MGRPQLYSAFALRAALVVPILVCAGCWEKIEYKGPRSVSATKPQPPAATDPPFATGSPKDAPLVDAPIASIIDPPAVEPDSPLPAASEAVATALTPNAATAVAGDRYATPPASDSASSDTPPADHPPGITSPASFSSMPPETTEPATTDTAPRADAVVASAAEGEQIPTSLNSRRAAWLLGSWLSLAALANDRGLAAQNVPVWLEDARKAARFLGTSVADLPAPASTTDSTAVSKQAVDYLLVHGQRIGRELAKGHGPEESALFEVALKSNILLVLYSPGASAGNSISLAIAQAAPRARLPADLWQPLVEAIQKQAPAAEVRAAVRKLHTDADQYLSQSLEPKG